MTSPVLQSIAVTPVNPTIPTGGTQQFAAMGMFSDGSSRTLTSIIWSSSAPAVATINSTGLATGLSAGSTIIIATSGSTSGTTTLGVTALVLQSIAVTPANPTIPTGGAQQFAAMGMFSDGSIQTLTSVNWNSSAPAVATINSTGLATGVGAGSTTIKAISGSVSGTTTLGVTSQLSSFAFVVNGGLFGAVTVLAISPTTGALTQIAGSPFPAHAGSDFLVFNPSGQFAYVTNFLSDDVSAFTVNAKTGVLVPIVGSPFSAGPGSPGNSANTMTVDPSGKFAYVLTTSNNISAFTIDAATGALTSIAGSPFGAGTNPASVTMDSLGKFAYVANAGSDNVSVFSINATNGVLTPVVGSPFAAGSFATSVGTSVTIHPSGKFAYVANFGSHDISAFTIDGTTGALTAISGSPFAAGTFPLPVTIDPSGKFAYVANFGSHDISAFTIDGTTGALTAISGSPFAAGTQPNSATIHPSGKFLYVSNNASNDISAFTIDATTGVLTAVPGSPFASGTSPGAVTVDPLGKFAYFNNGSAFTIDSTTGVLTPVSGSPFALGPSPQVLVIR